jgi:hypothetical protein
MRCEDIADALAGVAEGDELRDRQARRHVEGCLRCQAELAQHRKLLKALRTLRTEVLTPAPGLVAEVLASLEEAGERHAVRSLLEGRRLAYVGGVAVASAAAAAGVGVALVLANRSRGSSPSGPPRSRSRFSARPVPRPHRLAS